MVTEQQETAAAYIMPVCAELRKMAESADLQVLALILEMAVLEARKAGATADRQPESQLA